MEKFDLKKMHKKGSSKTGNQMTYLIGGLIVVVLAVSLAPEMFSSIAVLEADVNTPAWVSVVLYVIVGAGVVFLIWRSFGNN